MPILVIRHAISEANNRENIGTMAFGAKDAPLMEDLARPQMLKCRGELRSRYKLDPARVEAATSKLLRTQETAAGIGFKMGKPYAELNEVEHGVEKSILKQMLLDKELPPAALVAARAILADPPSKKVWVTHGLVIAGLCQELKVSGDFEHFIPKFCEIRALSI